MRSGANSRPTCPFSDLSTRSCPHEGLPVDDLMEIPTNRYKMRKSYRHSVQRNRRVGNETEDTINSRGDTHQRYVRIGTQRKEKFDNVPCSLWRTSICTTTPCGFITTLIFRKARSVLKSSNVSVQKEDNEILQNIVGKVRSLIRLPTTNRRTNN